MNIQGVTFVPEAVTRVCRLCAAAVRSYQDRLSDLGLISGRAEREILAEERAA